MNPWLRVPLRLIFPSICLLCKTDLLEDRESLCLSCRKGIRLELKIDLRPTKSLDALISVTIFEGKIRELIHLFKYKGHENFSKILSSLMVGPLEKFGFKFDCAVPVPSPFWREMRRGYNPSRLLAEDLAGRLHIPWKDRWLKRKSWSRPQMKLSRKERIKNATASFFTRRHLPGIGGSYVLLVDDVVTTGATLKHCAFLLRSAGAQSVVAVAFARDLFNQKGN